MTYYKYFANKTTLALFILDELYSDGMTEYHRIMDSQLSYAEKIDLSIKLKLDNAKNLSQEFINELYKNGEPEIMDFMHKMAGLSIETFMADFRSFQERGEIRRDVKPEFMFYMINKMMEMTTDDNFIRLFDNPTEMVSSISKFCFYGIMPVEASKMK
jgi:hypothetical protein